MASLRHDFVEGGVANGYPRERVVEVFNIIQKSQGYAFNKSHAVAYTLSSYWSMWFKVKYPVVYAVAEMTVEGEGDSNKLKRYIDVARQGRIKIYPPDINKSEWGFTPEEDGVRCGLSMVKRFSERAFVHVKKKRPYKEFADFMEDVQKNKRVLNKGAIQCLIGAGAFDEFGTRKALSEAVDDWKAILKKFKDKKVVLVLHEEEWNSVEKGKVEFNSLGFYLTVDPLKSFAKKLEAYKLTSDNDFRDALRGERVRIAGVVMTISPYKSKKGQMAFVDIMSSKKEYTLNVWAEMWLKVKEKFGVGDVVVCGGDKLEGNRVSVGEKDNLKRVS
jgi:DNA polymerase-3 subunit alpha